MSGPQVTWDEPSQQAHQVQWDDEKPKQPWIDRKLGVSPEMSQKMRDESHYDPRPLGDVQDWWKNAKEHPLKAAGSAALGALQMAPLLMGGGSYEPAEIPPINVKGPGEIPPTMIRPRAYYGGQPPAPIPPRQGLQLRGEVARPEIPPVYPGANLPEHPGEFPGAPLPAAPPAEVLKAKSLATGPQSPPPPAGAPLGKIPLRPPSYGGYGEAMNDSVVEDSVRAQAEGRDNQELDQLARERMDARMSRNVHPEVAPPPDVKPTASAPKPAETSGATPDQKPFLRKAKWLEDRTRAKK